MPGPHLTSATFNQNSVTVGDDAAAISELGDATAGERGAALSSESNASAGDSGIAASSAELMSATAGNSGVAIVFGRNGTAIAADAGVALGNWLPLLEAGAGGIALSMEGGLVTVGGAGLAIVVSDGRVGPNWNRVAAGENGTLILGYYDETAARDRFVVGYVGENDVEAGVYYYADENGRIRRATQPAKGAVKGDPLIPLSKDYHASFIVTGGTKRCQSSRSSHLDLKVETSVIFDGLEIFILKYSSPEFEALQFAANTEEGYADANFCYTALSLHYKYPAQTGDTWEYVGGDGADPETYQMKVLGTDEVCEADGVTYEGCFAYERTGIGNTVVTDFVKPGVGLIDHRVETGGITLTHWERRAKA